MKVALFLLCIFIVLLLIDTIFFSLVWRIRNKKENKRNEENSKISQS